MHIDFALPVNHDLLAGFKQWQEKAKAACADYGFHMAVTSWGPKVAADMAALVKQGINSFKFFMAYKVNLKGCVATDGTVRVMHATTAAASLAA
jgi:dihydropyrimidinase